jgi:hypothetical protein
MNIPDIVLALIGLIVSFISVLLCLLVLKLIERIDRIKTVKQDEKTKKYRQEPKETHIEYVNFRNYRAYIDHDDGTIFIKWASLMSINEYADLIDYILRENVPTDPDDINYPEEESVIAEVDVMTETADLHLSISGKLFVESNGHAIRDFLYAVGPILPEHVSFSTKHDQVEFFATSTDNCDEQCCHVTINRNAFLHIITLPAVSDWIKTGDPELDDEGFDMFTDMLWDKALKS